MSKKTTKQEVKDEDVSFGASISPSEKYSNISKAAEAFNSEEPEEKIVTEKNYEKSITFSIHKELSNTFHSLFKQYEIAIFDHNYEIIDQKQFFTTVISFYVDILKEQKDFKIAPEGFLKSVTRKGRRATTDRTRKLEDRSHLFLGITKNTYDDYFNIMFSFIKMNNDLDPTVFSTSYFFYDLVDFITENIEEIIKYSFN